MAAAIHSNMSLTDRASKRLLSFPYFRDSRLSQTKDIACLRWSLLGRVPDKDGIWICVQGPHFTLTTQNLADLNKYPRTYVFAISDHLLCVDFSKDWDFDPATRFRLDYTDEFILYPAALDEGEAARAPSKPLPSGSPRAG